MNQYVRPYVRIYEWTCSLCTFCHFRKHIKTFKACDISCLQNIARPWCYFIVWPTFNQFSALLITFTIAYISTRALISPKHTLTVMNWWQTISFQISKWKLYCFISISLYWLDYIGWKIILINQRPKWSKV